ncbi:MAG: hypothetical protein ACRED1_14580, partial [Limisphaerales bacterium]
MMVLFSRRQACPLIAIGAVSLFLCSCATPRLAPAPASAPIPFNADAGQGNWINVTLHLQSGRPIAPVEVDTGWPYKTIFDKSLEPLLGKRLGKTPLYTPFAGLKIVDVYAAPKLYLGHEPLRMSSRVYAFDLQKLAPGLKGILGMDCLRHYCVQFDFSRHQMRFLSPGASANGALGHAIPLTILD